MHSRIHKLGVGELRARAAENFSLIEPGPILDIVGELRARAAGAAWAVVRVSVGHVLGLLLHVGLGVQAVLPLNGAVLLLVEHA